MNSSERDKIKYEGLGGGIKGSTGLSWLFCLTDEIANLKEYVVSPKEKAYLRELAYKVRTLAELPVQKQRRKLWEDHLSLKETRPAIFIDPEQAWFEIFPHTSLKCTNALARIWEFLLKKEIYWQEEIGDDRVCRSTFSVQDIVHISGFGVTERKIGGADGGAYHIDPVIVDYDRDMPKLKFRELDYDKKASAKLRALAEDVFDGILTVVRDNSFWFSAGLTVDFIQLRGFDNFMYDFYDYPDEMHALMAFLRDDWLHMLRLLEENDLLTLNNGGEFMGTGGYGWCRELPAPDYSGHARPIDMWGYSESQEAVSVSPDMFGEFILPYQVPILEKFGLTSYGCCEPLDNKIDLLKKEVPRLRKVTVSPWSDVNFMAEQLGKDYAMCWKMSAACISSPEIDEELIRSTARNAIDACRRCGCSMEILNRDILTLSYCPQNARRWVEIMREEAER